MGREKISSWIIDSKGFSLQKNTRERILFLLRYAVLAPSTHNSQPWLFEVTNNSCKVYYDPSYYLREADHDGKYAMISIGCLIENLVTAAKYFGVYKSINFNSQLKTMKEYLPVGDPLLLSEVFFNEVSKPKKNPTFSKSFSAITQRFDARGVFKDKIIPQPVIDYIEKEATGIPVETKLITGDLKISKIAELTGKGMIVAHSNKDFRKELSGWIRNTFSAKNDGMSAESMRVPFPLTFFISTLIKYVDMSPVLSKLSFMSVNSAKSICVISSNNNLLEWLKVGMAAERVMLGAYNSNLNTSIYVAAVDDANLRKQLKRIVQAELEPQFLITLGYLDLKTIHTVRHNVNLKVLGYEK